MLTAADQLLQLASSDKNLDIEFFTRQTLEIREPFCLRTALRRGLAWTTEQVSHQKLNGLNVKEELFLVIDSAERSQLPEPSEIIP